MKMKTFLKTITAAMALILLANYTARAQTIIVDMDRSRVPILPDQPRHMPVDPVQLRDHRVNVTVTDQIATYKIIQNFFNHSHQQLEGTYIFPLPEGAAISSFSMMMNGQMVAGEVLDQKQARNTYETIVRRRKDPGLLEYVGKGLIRARIFPIAPRTETKIEFEFVQILAADAGLVGLRYPLRAQDTRSQQYARPNITFCADIRSRTPITNVFSTSHPIDKKSSDVHHVTASFEGKIGNSREDFVLYYSLSKKDFGLNLITHRLQGENGYFTLLLSPNLARENTTPIPKDIIFVLDTSGSMTGKKMEQAKEALKFALSNLLSEDRYNVIPFSTEARPFHETPVGATKENIAADLYRLGELRAAGGTNISDSVTLGLKSLASADRIPMMVFITDGQPTIGETNIQTILSMARAQNQSKCRIFVFGVGNDVNTFLLDNLAEESSGTREYVAENENIEFKVSSFYDKVSHPVLADLAISIDGAKFSDVYPKNLPDLFLGSQLTVMGRFSGTGHKAIRLRGKIRDQVVEYVYEAKLAEQCLQNGEIKTLWARRKVGYLLDQIRLNGHNLEVENEIVRLGKKYGIVTPYTSYLILEDGATPLLGAAFQRGRRGPANAPSTLKDGRGRQQEGRLNFVGADAVRESKTIARLKSSTLSSSGQTLPGKKAEEAEASPSKIRKGGGKSFVLRKGVWIDTQLLNPAQDAPKLDTIKVQAYSTEYFALIRANARLAKILAIADRLRVLFDGKIYEITPPTN